MGAECDDQFPLKLVLSGTIDPAIHGTIGVAANWNHTTHFDNLTVQAAQGPQCEPDHDPAAELCDGLDNDCDNSKDEPYKSGGTVTYTDLDGTTGLRLNDPCGVGACAGGKVVCGDDLNTLTCSTAHLAHAEVCDGVDNDCDGKTDSADPADLLANDLQSCEKQNGVCSGSKKPAVLCQGGSWVACATSQYVAHNNKYEANKEIRCDGFDNDCDGSVDEDFTMTQLNGTTVSGIGKACGVGVCGGGVTTCTGNDLGIYCPTEANASPEVCDAKDNDCDGKTDHTEGMEPTCSRTTCSPVRTRKGLWRLYQAILPLRQWVAQTCSNTQYANHSSISGGQGDPLRRVEQRLRQSNG